MEKITLYEPICSRNNSIGGRLWFTVNGSIDTDRDSAIRKAKKHVAFREGNGGKIERIDEHRAWDEDFYGSKDY